MDAFDNAFDLVVKQTTAALEHEGKISVAQIQNSISENYPPASTPGNPPARRTGNLWRGVSASPVERHGDSLDMVISSTRVGGNPNVPSFLEAGTTKMLPRPYMRPEVNRLKTELAPAIAGFKAPQQVSVIETPILTR